MRERTHVIRSRHYRFLHLAPKSKTAAERPVWFIPGLGFRPDHYEPFLRALAVNREVFASEFTWALSRSSVSRYLEHIRDLKADLNLGPHVLIGHSLGTVPALLEAQHPDVVISAPIDRVVVINPAPPLTALEPQEWIRVTTGGLRIMTNDLLGPHATPASRAFALRILGEIPGIARSTVATLAKQDLLKVWSRAYARNWKAPILVLASERDEYFAPKTIRRVFQSGQSHLEPSIIPTVNHHGLNFQPELFLEAIQAFEADTRVHLATV